MPAPSPQPRPVKSGSLRVSLLIYAMEVILPTSQGCPVTNEIVCVKCFLWCLKQNLVFEKKCFFLGRG